MPEDPNNQNIQINNNGQIIENMAIPVENKAYLNLRRIALISTIVLILVVFITLLYLNGKSLYEHGL